MKKYTLALIVVCLLIFPSCKKSTGNNVEVISPLHKVLDNKFLTTVGTTLIVDYASYNSIQQIDKPVLNAAQSTVEGNFGIERVEVKGSKLSCVFIRGSSTLPNSYNLTSNSSLENEALTTRNWLAVFTVTKLNTLISQADFEKGVNFNVSGVGINGNQIKILEKIITANQMQLVCEMIYGQRSDENNLMTFKIQSNIAVKYALDFDVEYYLENSKRIIVPYPKNRIQPTITDIGNGTTQFDGYIGPDYSKLGLREFLASYYWMKEVVPILK